MGEAQALDPDAALMLKASAGDNASFELLLHRHRASVVNHMCRFVRNHAIAEELAQDVFLRVYRSRASYQPEAKFTTWLFRISTNVALNWRRDTRRESGVLRLDEVFERARKVEISDGVPRVDERLIREHRSRQVREAIEALPAKQHAAVILHKYDGLDYTEIAQVLNCSIPALKSLLFRAYETLRNRLADFSPDAGSSGGG